MNGKVRPSSTAGQKFLRDTITFSYIVRVNEYNSYIIKVSSFMVAYRIYNFDTKKNKNITTSNIEVVIFFYSLT